MASLRRSAALIAAAALAAASFPGEAAAALARVPEITAWSAAGLPAAAPPAILSAGVMAPPAAFFAPAASAAPLPFAPFPALARAVSAAPPLAAERGGAAPKASPVASVAGGDALFDGRGAAASGAETPPAPAAAPVEPSPLGRGRLARFVAPAGDLPLASDPRGSAALKKSIAAGLAFAALEFAGGLFTGTLALRADALHLAGDRALDAAALLALRIARRPPTLRNTYGWLKAEAVFSLIGAFAVSGMGALMVPGVVQAFRRPAPAAGWSVLAFAALSVAANLTSAVLLRRGRAGHPGIRGAFLHALLDASGTVGMMLAASASLLWGWSWPMPVATAAMVGLVLSVAWELGRPAWDVLLDAVPPGVDMKRLESDLLALPGAAGVRDLHVRTLNSLGAELAAKLYARPGADHAAILAGADAFLRARYGIVHSTIQIEPLPAER